MPLRETPISPVSVYDILNATAQRPDTGLLESLGNTIPQDFMDAVGMGTAYKHFMAPRLERQPIGTTSSGRSTRTVYRSLTEEEAQQRGVNAYRTKEEYARSPWFHPDVPFEIGMTEARAKALFNWQTNKEIRQAYRDEHPIASTLSMFLVGVADPINAIPVAGPIAKGASLTMKVVGAVGEGMAANLLASGLTAQERSRYDINEGTANQVMQDTLLGGLYGPLLYGAGALGRSMYRYMKGRRKTATPQPVQPSAPQAGAPPVSAPGVSPPSPVLDTGQGITFNYERPYAGLRYWDKASNEEVIASRIIVNDAINYLNDGKDPQLSSGTQDLIMKMGPEVYTHIEAERYEQLKREEENKDRIQELEENVGLYRSYIDTLKSNYDKVYDRLRSEAQTNPVLKTMMEFRAGTSDNLNALDRYDVLSQESELSIEHQQLLQQLADLRWNMDEMVEELRTPAAHLAILRTSTRNGYLEDPPPILQNFDYTRMTTANNLPSEVFPLLPQDVVDKINTISSTNVAGLSHKDIGDIKFAMAPHLGPLYNGTYAYMLHSTEHVFEEFDTSHLGKSTGSESAMRAFWFARSYVTSEYYAGNMEPPLSVASLVDAVNDFTYKSNTEKLEAMAGMLSDQMKGQLKDEQAKLVDLTKKYLDAAYELDVTDPKNVEDFISAENAKLDAYNEAMGFALKIDEKAQPPSPNVRPSNITLKNPYVYDMQNATYHADLADGRTLSSHIDEAKAKGNDGVIFLNFIDPGHADTHIAIWNTDQIDSAITPARPIVWTEPKVDVDWRTTESDLDKAALAFAKPMDPVTKLDQEADVTNLDLEKSNGVLDAELDRMDIEAAKSGMTEAQAKAFDDGLKAIEDDMIADDRLDAATTAIIGCKLS